MAFMKDILTRNIPIWEECAATPFVQEVQTGKLPLEKFKHAGRDGHILCLCPTLPV